MNNPNIVYSTKTAQYDVPFADYTAYGKTYGNFSADGETYTVTNKRTPRQWLNFSVNDDFGSIAANDGSGYAFYKTANFAVTKYYSTTDYLVRTLNGRREIVLTDADGKSVDLLQDCEDLRFEAHFGFSAYFGSVNGVRFEIVVFVPQHDPLEIWKIRLAAQKSGKYTLRCVQHASGKENGAAKDAEYSVVGDTAVSTVEANIFGVEHRAAAFFHLQGGRAYAEAYDETYENGVSYSYVKEGIEKEISLQKDVEATYCALSGAIGIDGEKDECKGRTEIKAIIGKYADLKETLSAEEEVRSYARAAIDRNSCVLPDKNLQHFLNVWLKNQIRMTLRYNRCDIMGYRDVMQDAWGHLLVSPAESKPYLLQALSKMHADGRCPRQYDRISDRLDDRDFMDSPIWSAIAVTDYVKETGDFEFLSAEVGWIETAETDSVKEHVLRAFDRLHELRGKNGLLLMRDGDWLDGLSGINRYGEATTVWGTIAVFYAQNLFAELLDFIGDTKNAERLKTYSSEYRRVVNDVGWDGKWYTYAFIDEQPIGSARCNEGKIYLNAQTWAILSGIYDSEQKLQSMYEAIHTYLSSMYGPHLLFPPYISEGEKFGRLLKHKPGTFSNGAIYLHGAAFKAAADCAAGRMSEALDTFSRILPNHRDQNDGRRTSEPYAVGNVYFGITHECFGLNLYTWFTATPSWLIHVGFEGLLGVKADFDGLRVRAKDLFEGESYQVTRKFRNNVYRIRVFCGEEKGVFVNGEKLQGDLIAYRESCEPIYVDVCV